MAEHLDAALTTARDLREDLASSAIDGPVRGELVDRVDRVVAALEGLVSQRLGVAVSVAPLSQDVLPGDLVEGTVTVTNSGDTTLTDLLAEVSVEGWTVDASDLELGTLAARSTTTLPFSAKVPLGASPGPRDASVTLAFTSAGQTYRVSSSGRWATVSGGVTISDVVGSVPSAGTPEKGLVEVTVDNPSSGSADGRVELTLPDGWPPAVPSLPVTVPAGRSLSIELPVLVPRRVVATDHPVTARFVRGDDTLAEADGSIPVTLATPPSDAEGATDHVDFGDSASENAHGIQASPSSGTSVEAGLTRRYANSTVPGPSYSAQVEVAQDQPFVVRIIETFDGATTKEFNLYADGVFVDRYSISRSAGGSAGWRTRSSWTPRTRWPRPPTAGSGSPSSSRPTPRATTRPSRTSGCSRQRRTRRLRSSPPVSTVRPPGATAGPVVR